MLDLLQWWFGDDINCVEYFDDAAGGVESECAACFRIAGAVEAKVTFSRLRELRNSCVIVGEKATLEVGLDPAGR